MNLGWVDKNVEQKHEKIKNLCWVNENFEPCEKLLHKLKNFFNDTGSKIISRMKKKQNQEELQNYPKI